MASGKQYEGPAPLPPSIREEEVEKHEWAMWLSEQPLPKKLYYRDNEIWRRLRASIKIHHLGGVAGDDYLEWAIRSREGAISLWTSLGLERQVVEFLRTSSDRLRNRNFPMFAEASGGMPWGSYMGALSCDARRRVGLFVQVHGSRNLVPCECCENRYLARYHHHEVAGPSPTKRPRTRAATVPRDTQRHVMLPWFGCVSVPGFQNGACGNCLYHVEAEKCSFSKPRGGMTEDLISLKATLRRPSMEVLGERKLSRDNSPRVSLVDSEPSKHRQEVEKKDQDKGFFLRRVQAL